MPKTVTRPAGLSMVEAARQLSISKTGIYRLLDRGEIQTVRIGHRRIVPAAEIDRLLAVDDPE